MNIVLCEEIIEHNNEKDKKIIIIMEKCFCCLNDFFENNKDI